MVYTQENPYFEAKPSDQARLSLSVKQRCNSIITGITRLGLLTLLLAQCAQPTNKSVKKDWIKTIRNYGLIPVYPMRENVYVGDVSISNNLDNPNILNYRLFGRLNVDEILASQIKKMPALPKTEVDTNGNPVSTQVTGNITGPRDNADRMNIVALPSVTVGRVSAFDLAAIGPIGKVAANTNFFNGSSSSVSISLHGIESIELYDVNAFHQLNKLCVSKEINGENVQAALNASVAQLRDSTQTNEKVYVSVITRVFYARQISYTSTNQKKISGGANLGKKQDDLSPVSASDIQHDTDGNPIIPQATDLSSSVQKTPGIAATFAQEFNGEIKLTQTFERPLAFGVEVLSFDAKSLSHSGSNCTYAANTSGNFAALTAPNQLSAK